MVTLGALKGRVGNRIKIYLVVGLAMVLAALVYRHLKVKPSGNAPPSPPSTTWGLAEVANFAPLDMGSLQRTQLSRTKVKELRRDFLRDVFVPMRPLQRAEQRISPKGQPRVQKAPNLKLKGVIVGGSNSVAIINGKLLRLGERIDGYEIVRIQEKEVFLRSGNSTFKLELVQND